MDERDYTVYGYYEHIVGSVYVSLEKDLLRQDMENQIWKTTSSKLIIIPEDGEYEKHIKKELDLDDDEITVTITTKKGKKIEFTKKLEIHTPTEEELREWDKTHDKEFISRMRCPPGDEYGGNRGF